MRKSPQWYLCISIQPPLFFLFPLIFVYCGKFIHNIKIIINHFSVFNLVILNTFITLCNHDHCLSPQLFLSCETEAPCSLNNNSPFLPPSSPSTTILLFVSKIFFFGLAVFLVTLQLVRETGDQGGSQNMELQEVQQGRMGSVLCQALNIASCMTLHKFLKHAGFNFSFVK